MIAFPFRPRAAASDTPSPSAESIAYRADIDGLRAIAVLAVLLFHALPEQLRGGFVGVNVFFVISGFLISKVILGALERGTFSVVDFYVRRIRRIFPALLLVLFVCLAFGWETMLAEDLIGLAKHVVGGAAFVSNLMLWQEAGYFDKASELKPLLHLWSLGIEEQFYLVWPILLWWGWRAKLSPFILVAGTASLSFLLNVAGVHDHQTVTFYSPLSRAWELFAGASLALHARAGRREGRWTSALDRLAGPRLRSWTSLAGVALVLGAAVGFDRTFAFPGWWALIPCAGACLVITAGPKAYLNRVVLANPLMVGIGLISYPLYLWHWPVLTLVGPLLAQGDSLFVRLSLLLLSIALATATYYLVEKPFRNGRRMHFKVALLGTSMLVLAGTAGAIFQAKGVPTRYPEIVQKATQFDLEGYRAGLRNHKCFMDIGQTAAEFASECVDAGSKPLWTLWGDSGAATLYPGFRALAERAGSIRLAQFTSSACPPLLGYTSRANSACRATNDAVFERLRSMAPEVVVLSAIWVNYDPARLTETIAQIKGAGVSRIYVLGPAPAWKEAPSRIAFTLWKEDPLHRMPPARLSLSQYGYGEESSRRGGSEQRSAPADNAVRALAEQSGAKYISLLDALCDPNGCLTRESKESGDSFYLDIVHLNRTGSEYVMRAIANQLSLGPKLQ
jgi:peptidoglycan/LPS O-acetylase OafA/YrhL